MMTEISTKRPPVDSMSEAELRAEVEILRRAYDDVAFLRYEDATYDRDGALWTLVVNGDRRLYDSEYVQHMIDAVGTLNAHANLAHIAGATRDQRLMRTIAGRLRHKFSAWWATYARMLSLYVDIGAEPVRRELDGLRAICEMYESACSAGRRGDASELQRLSREHRSQAFERLMSALHALPAIGRDQDSFLHVLTEFVFFVRGKQPDRAAWRDTIAECLRRLRDMPPGVDWVTPAIHELEHALDDPRRFAKTMHDRRKRYL